MMFKPVIFVIALLTGASAQLQGATANAERTVSFGTNQHKARGGLDLQGLLKFLEDEDFSRLRGPQKNRRLQTLVGPEGETMTKQQIIDYFKAATGASGDGKSPYEDCKDLFESFDQNGDGFLSLNELASLFQAITGCSRKFGLQLAQALIDWYDLDGDETLNQDELDAVCKGGKIQQKEAHN
jgi:EF hand